MSWEYVKESISQIVPEWQQSLIQRMRTPSGTKVSLPVDVDIRASRNKALGMQHETTLFGILCKVSPGYEALMLQAELLGIC